MNYPLISENVEAIKSFEDNFEQLKNLRPVLGEDVKNRAVTIEQIVKVENKTLLRYGK